VFTARYALSLYIKQAHFIYSFISQPTVAQLFYNRQHVSASTIRPSSGSRFFLRQQAAYDTLENG
jgi:hypothetical protein